MPDQAKAFEDSDHVLRFLDGANIKALNRRAVASKALGNIEDSIRDFQTILKTKPTNEAEVKKELDELLKKLVEQ